MLAPRCSPSPTSPKVATRPLLDAIAAAFGPGLIHRSERSRPPPRGLHHRRRGAAPGGAERRAGGDRPHRHQRARGHPPARGRRRRRADRLPERRASAARPAPRRSCSPTSSGSSASPSISTASSPEDARAPSCAGTCRPSRPTSARRRIPPPARRWSPRGRRWSPSTSRSTPRSQTAKEIARELRTTLDVRALGPAGRARAGLDQHRERADDGRGGARRSERTRRVTGAELVAPAPRAAFAGFPDDVPLRAPKPLEDHLLS